MKIATRALHIAFLCAQAVIMANPPLNIFVVLLIFVQKQIFTDKIFVVERAYPHIVITCVNFSRNNIFLVRPQSAINTKFFNLDNFIGYTHTVISSCKRMCIACEVIMGGNNREGSTKLRRLEV